MDRRRHCPWREGHLHAGAARDESTAAGAPTHARPPGRACPPRGGLDGGGRRPTTTTTTTVDSVGVAFLVMSHFNGVRGWRYGRRSERRHRTDERRSRRGSRRRIARSPHDASERRRGPTIAGGYRQRGASIEGGGDDRRHTTAVAGGVVPSQADRRLSALPLSKLDFSLVSNRSSKGGIPPLPPFGIGTFAPQ